VEFAHIFANHALSQKKNVHLAGKTIRSECWISISKSVFAKVSSLKQLFRTIKFVKYVIIPVLNVRASMITAYYVIENNFEKSMRTINVFVRMVFMMPMKEIAKVY